MVDFIAKMILNRYYEKSVEEAIELYKKYFVYTPIYLAYRQDVDNILKAEGAEQVISR